MKMRLCLALILIVLSAGGVAAQKSFYSKEFKFGFKIPSGSKVIRDSENIAAAPHFTGVAYITLRNPGHGVYDATAAVSAGNITRNECRALSTAEDKPRKKKFGTVTFDQTSEVEGGMESVHPVEFFRTFKGGLCYEVRLMIGMEKYPKRRINDRAAFERLYSILRTFYFR